MAILRALGDRLARFLSPRGEPDDTFRPNGWHAALILFWATEVFVVQYVTLKPTLWQTSMVPIYHQSIRAWLDVLICAVLVAALRVRYLTAVWVLHVFVSAILLVYHDYFGRPLSVFTISSQLGEGAQVTGAGVSLLEPSYAVLLATFAVKVLLGRRAERGRALAPGRARWVAVAALAYCTTFYLGNRFKPIYRLGIWETMSGVAFAFGYGATWVAELVYVEHEQLLERALERAKVVSDRLSPREAPFPLREHLVMLQVESLDFAALDFEVKGEAVTPYTSRIAKKSMLYKIQATKVTGSCDSDFTALMGKLASEDVPIYRIEDYPYDGALPSRLAHEKFSTSFVHGVSGSFFNRRPAYAKMGFADIAFKEELVERRGLDPEPWCLADVDVMEYAAQRFAELPGRRFQMVITATSHLPYKYVPREAITLYPGDSEKEWLYFDAIRYCDRAVGEYVETLPEGTTVVLYADHWSKVVNHELGYEPELRDGFGLVPFMVYNVGEDLSGVSRVRESGLALSGDLTLLDTMTWVHRHIDAALTADRETRAEQRPRSSAGSSDG